MSTDLHVAFHRQLSADIRATAAKRGLSPQVLVAATMRLSMDGDLLDAIFDGTDPQEAAGGQARHANGMTYYQCAVMHLVGTHRDANGTCHMSAVRIARMIPNATPTGVVSVLGALIAKGLLVKAPKVTSNGVQPHRLTAAGAIIAMELSGE